MKVLHINQSDISGGAAIAAYRLHEGLLAQQVDSRLLVGKQTLDDERITAMPRRYRLDNQFSRLTRPLGLNYINIVSTFDIPKLPLYQSVDILNFHNLHYRPEMGYFNYLALSKLTQEKPAVFTLHDMWSFTGHCAYSYDCDRWKTGCGQCRHPETYPAIQRDSTNVEWRLKNWTYGRSRLTIVAPSRWLAEQARQSMLGQFEVHHIPYGIDIQAYQPLDPEQCRTVLGISTTTKVLMFGAKNLGQDRKGSDLLLAALQKLPHSIKKNVLLLAMGNNNHKDIEQLTGINTLALGYLDNDRLKAVAYSAADLFVLPSRADNLPLVLQESMACGTPMLSFNTGGIPDLIRPGITGYLAQPEYADDLGNGILELLEDNEQRKLMGQQCRAIAVKEYALERQAQLYKKLYTHLLTTGN
ncbi:MAG: glycosyltransferase family 4 protein [Anaerolineaceae bacterium]|nr:glycosyltransferase family 4 protein [Anaerolineaceae bacterium]